MNLCECAHAEWSHDAAAGGCQTEPCECPSYRAARNVHEVRVEMRLAQAVEAIGDVTEGLQDLREEVRRIAVACEILASHVDRGIAGESASSLNEAARVLHAWGVREGLIKESA
ncbi:MAG TPA: hypothetical protein VEA41_05785 [Salinarimonas sp.]|nr:hypothetical protein [Salinarimonas sp.]